MAYSAEITTAPPPVIRSMTWWQRIVLIALCLLSLWSFDETSKHLDWPLEPGHCCSLIHSLRPVTGIAIIALGTLIAMVLGSLLLSRSRHEAGLFVAACGMTALAVRCGTVGATLRSSSDPKIYLLLLADTLIILAVLVIAWAIVRVFTKPAQRRIDVGDSLVAAAVHVAIMALLLLLFAREDKLKEAMTCVFLASLVAALIAHQTVSVPSSASFWIGSFAVGVGGYIWAAVRPGEWNIGIPANALANVPPFGYASLGVAGALLGYWLSSRWKTIEEEPITLEGA